MFVFSCYISEKEVDINQNCVLYSGWRHRQQTEEKTQVLTKAITIYERRGRLHTQSGSHDGAIATSGTDCLLGNHLPQIETATFRKSMESREPNAVIPSSSSSSSFDINRNHLSLYSSHQSTRDYTLQLLIACTTSLCVQTY